MSVTLQQVRSAIDEACDLNDGEVALPIWEAGGPFGVGVDGQGRVVLVLRSCELSVNVLSDNFEFRPTTSITIKGQGIVEVASVLFVNRPLMEVFDVDAVATVFLGLIEVSGDPEVVLSEVIEGLAELFETGRLRPPSVQEQIGLAGELLVISQAEDLEFAVECWRSGGRDRFDFSHHSERVDVKSTTQKDRIHHFSDGQIPGPADCVVVIASVMLQRVEVGESITQLLDSIWNRLTTRAAKADLMRKAGVVIGSSSSQDGFLNFDLEASRQSILFVGANEIPRPMQIPGVLTMSWSSLVIQGTDLPVGAKLISTLCHQNC